MNNNNYFNHGIEIEIFEYTIQKTTTILFVNQIYIGSITMFHTYFIIGKEYIYIERSVQQKIIFNS